MDSMLHLKIGRDKGQIIMMSAWRTEIKIEMENMLIKGTNLGFFL